MIGAFARMLGNRDHVLSCEQTGDDAYAVRTRADAAVASEARDQTPDGFVERIPHEGGIVVFAPILEALRSVLRGKPRTDPGTLPRLPQNEEPSAEER